MGVDEAVVMVPLTLDIVPWRTWLAWRSWLARRMAVFRNRPTHGGALVVRAFLFDDQGVVIRLRRERLEPETRGHA